MPRKNKTLFKIDGFDVSLISYKNRAPRHAIYLDTGRKYLHRYLANKYIRLLLPGEIVHHKDFNPLNDVVSNLEIMSRADHVRIHKPVLGYKFTDEQKQRLSDSHKGQIPWCKGKFGFKHSAQSKRNMSIAQKGRIITWGDKISKAKEKVSKEQLLEFIKNNPTTKREDIMVAFDLKSPGPIYRHGGLKQLKKEAI